MAAPIISVERYLNLGFDSTGGTKNFTITYSDTAEQYINKPVLDISMGNIKVASTSVTGSTVAVTYTLNVYVSTFKRTVPMIFSCMNPDDGLMANTILNFVVGDTAPEDMGSKAYVAFDYPSFDFGANGGEADFTVEYGYPNTSIAPTYTLADSSGVKPITWASLNFESGTTAADRSKSEERYTATMQPNTSTTPRIARCSFTYTNSDGETTGNSIFLVQYAANGEAVEREEPSIEPYVTVVNVTSAGTNSLSSSINYINVKYTNLTDDEIGVPTINASWLRITDTESTVSNSTEIIKKYYWEADENSKTSSRTATITYNILYDGNTMTNTTVFTQAAAVIPPDDDDEEIPDIPVEGGAYIGAIWKDVEYSFGNIPTVNYSIYRGNEVIFKGRSVIRPNGNNNTIMVNKIIQNYLDNPILSDDAVSESFTMTPFYLKSENGSTTYKTYYFVNDWSYSDNFRTGVLQHPILNDNKVYRYQWMPFTVFSFGDTESVKYGVRYKAGSVNEYGYTISNWNSTLYATNEIKTDYFIRTRNSYPEKIDTVYIGNKEWKMVDNCKVRYVLYYVNPWGGYDWFPIEGRTVMTDEITPYKIQNNYNNQTLQFGKQRYLTEINRTYQMSTGWLSQEESDRMWYLLESNTVYMQDLWENKMYPVVLRDTMVEHKERTLLSSRIRYTINVELSQTRERK